MIKCNQCSVAPSAGPYFRTSCRHLLCDKCAKDAFTSHCYCPICNTQLRPQDVIEFLAGVPPIGMHETIFQIAFQDVAFEAVVDNSNKVMQCATELMAFVQSQLLMELQKESSVRHQLEAGHESYKNESSKAMYQMREQSTMLTQRIQVLEQQVESRDKELDEIREAYQSKVKKCTAWEKAYNAIKDQAIGGLPNSTISDSNHLLYGENVPGVPNAQEHIAPGLKAVNHTGALIVTDRGSADVVYCDGGRGGLAGGKPTAAGNWMQRVTTTETMRVLPKAPHSYNYPSQQPPLSSSGWGLSSSSHATVPPPVYRPHQAAQQQHSQYQQQPPPQQQQVLPMRHRAMQPMPPAPPMNAAPGFNPGSGGKSHYFFDRVNSFR